MRDVYAPLVVEFSNLQSITETLADANLSPAVILFFRTIGVEILPPESDTDRFGATRTILGEPGASTMRMP